MLTSPSDPVMKTDQGNHRNLYCRTWWIKLQKECGHGLHVTFMRAQGLGLGQEILKRCLFADQINRRALTD